jgi:hypothetical protein
MNNSYRKSRLSLLASLLAACLCLTLFGCASPESFVDPASKPAMDTNTKGYVAGIFAGTTAVYDYGLGFVNVVSGEEYLFSFGLGHFWPNGKRTDDMVRMIEVPPGLYKFTYWQTFEPTTHQSHTKKMLSDSENKFRFEVRPGKVSFIGTYEVQSTLEGRTSYYRISPKTICREEFFYEFKKFYPNIPTYTIIDPLVGTKTCGDREREAFANPSAPITHTPDGKTVMPVSEAESRAEYEREKAASYGKREYHVAHILVESQTQADTILASLRNGTSFEEAAKQSMDGTRSNGGDLGWALAETYVSPFSDALRSMTAPGLYPTSVRSPYGWHVIRLLGMRPYVFPSYEEMRPQIERAIRKRASG